MLHPNRDSLSGEFAVPFHLQGQISFDASFMVLSKSLGFLRNHEAVWTQLLCIRFLP